MLLTMATHDTPENNRTWMTRRTLESMRETVDFSKHTLMVSDNGSVQETHRLYQEFADIITYVEYNGENIGTANALNKLWRFFARVQTRHCYNGVVCKIDNDVVWHTHNWAEQMEEVFKRDPNIGIVGLKRKDLWERPDHPDPHYRSTLRMLSHKAGQRWLVVEECNHIMGTCQAYSSALFDRIGYLYQMDGLYGFDDSLASVRAHVAGYKTVFLLGIEIDHIDPGGTAYNDWKHKYTGERLEQFRKVEQEYLSGKRDIYYHGGFH